MTINLLLRALRKSECMFAKALLKSKRLEKCVSIENIKNGLDIERYHSLSDKLEARIVKMFKAIPLCAICSGVLVRSVEEELGIAGKPTGILK